MTDEISTRGLTSGGLGTVLRKFKGTLVDYIPEERDVPNSSPPRKSVSVKLQFKDIEVMAATEPYAFPTVEFSIPFSKNVASRWGIFATSVNSIIPPNEDIKDQKNKVFVMEATGGHKMRTKGENNTWVDTEIEAWEVESINGKGKGTAAGIKVKTPQQILEDLLDGKTKADFNSAAYALPEVKNSPDLQRTITDSSLVTALVTTGKFTVDDNKVYHKKT